MSRPNMRAHFARENARHAWMAQKPEPRPVQRIPALDISAADIRRESMQLWYGNLIHDGYTEDEAHAATIEHFAIADHREQENQS